ncbi:MAG: hypothetical protein ACE5R6_15915 [Candidatus Heimdallarchaeota archaeon]
MSCKKQLLSLGLLLCLSITPYVALAQITTFQPITPLPPEFTVKPKPITFETTPSAFATVTPQIDGAISSGYTYGGTEVPGEWDDAVKIDFLLNYTDGSESHNATLYIKNDYINLYMALVVRGEEYSKNDLAHFNFDNDNDGMLENGDDQLALFGTSNTFRDLYQTATDSGSTWDSKQDGVGYAQWYSPFIFTKPLYTIEAVNFLPLTTTPTAAGKAAQVIQPIQPILTQIPLQPITQPPLLPPITLEPELLHPIEPIQGTWVFEVAHPLDSTDSSHDINARIGDTIGISAAYWDMDNTGAGGAGGYPSFFNWADMFSYRIAGPPPTGGTADLSIDRIEVIQAIQTPDNELPLARRKTTVARVFLDIGPGMGPIASNVFLYARDPDTLSILPGPLVASVNAPATPQRDQITHSANFLLPNSWVDRDHLELLAFVTSATMETNFNNNWLDPTVTVTFHTMKVLNVYEMPFNTGTEAAPNTVSDALITSNEEAMLKTYPVDRINFIRLDWTAAGGPFTGNYDQRLAKLNEIAGQLVLAWLIAFIFSGGEAPDFPLPDQIYGYYTSGGGSSDPTWWEDGLGIAATGYIGTSQELTMAHEINHNLDKSEDGTWGRHAGPSYGSVNCWAGGPDPDWPYTNDDIQEIGLDVTVWPLEVVSSNKPDFMSYCQTVGGPYVKWVSDYRWNHLFAELERSPLYPAPTAEAAAKSAGVSDSSATQIIKPIQPIPIIKETRKALQVSGWVTRVPEGAIESILMVDTPTYEVLTAQLEQYPWLKSLVGDIVQPRTIAPVSRQEGIKYELVALDANGNELLSLSFLGSFSDPHGHERERIHFTRYIPMDEKLLAAGAKIQLRVGGKVLDEKRMSPNTPVVQVLKPVGGEIWSLRARAEISWTAKDPDGDVLQYTVQYSPDGGNLWIPLATGLSQKQTSLFIDPAKIPGSDGMNAYVRVLATDGFNTGQDMNEKPFSVARKAPKVYIDSPTDGQSFGARDIIPMKCHGFDIEDGELPDSAFTWEFEGGALGNGSAIDVVRIGPGDHVITLKGSDSDGMTGTASIKIHVLREEIKPVLIKEPTLRVGAGLSVKATIEPSNIGAGESAVLHAVVYNAGTEPAEEVKLTVGLPLELRLLGEIPIIWKVIPPGETVEAKFEVTGKDIGLYEIGLEASSANLRPGVASVFLGVEKEAPVIRPEETTTSPEKTTPPETSPKTSPPVSEPMKTITETETEAGPIPGFEAVPVLGAIPFLLWFRKRRRRR